MFVADLFKSRDHRRTVEDEVVPAAKRWLESQTSHSMMQ
jgi:hypothetical protein